jgi:hypothetical protein
MFTLQSWVDWGKSGNDGVGVSGQDPNLRKSLSRRDLVIGSGTLSVSSRAAAMEGVDTRASPR